MKNNIIIILLIIGGVAVTWQQCKIDKMQDNIVLAELQNDSAKIKHTEKVKILKVQITTQEKIIDSLEQRKQDTIIKYRVVKEQIYKLPPKETLYLFARNTKSNIKAFKLLSDTVGLVPVNSIKTANIQYAELIETQLLLSLTIQQKQAQGVIIEEQKKIIIANDVYSNSQNKRIENFEKQLKKEQRKNRIGNNIRNGIIIGILAAFLIAL